MMADYRLTATNWSVVRTSDNVSIPADPANRDRSDYEAWLALGNTPDPYVEPPPIAAQKARTASFNADATRATLLAQLQSSTPAQINAYVDNNVTNLAGAVSLFKKILLVMAQL